MCLSPDCSHWLVSLSLWIDVSQFQCLSSFCSFIVSLTDKYLVTFNRSAKDFMLSTHSWLLISLSCSRCSKNFVFVSLLSSLLFQSCLTTFICLTTYVPCLSISFLSSITQISHSRWWPSPVWYWPEGSFLLHRIIFSVGGLRLMLYPLHKPPQLCQQSYQSAAKNNLLMPVLLTSWICSGKMIRCGTMCKLPVSSKN